MINNIKHLYIGFAFAGLIGLGIAGLLDTNVGVVAQETNMTEMEHEGDMPTYVTRDSVTVNLEGTSLPAGQFIHLYDATPYHIMNGHVAVNVPCDDNSTADIQVLIGQAPNMTAADLEKVAELSTPGDLCLYHVDVIPSEVPGADVGHEVITDIAITNPGESDIEFPPGSTVVIGINEIMPGVEEHHNEEAEATE